MARPRKGDEKGYTEHVGFRTPLWVKEALIELAEADGAKSMGDVANEALMRYLKRQGYKPPESAAAK